MVDKVLMGVDFGGMAMKNPVNTASGCFGYGQQFEGFFDVGRLGAITTKGCSAVPWTGNPGPRMHEIVSGMMNSVGLQNPGIKTLAQEYGDYFQDLERRDCRVICQVAGHSIEEYIAAIELYEQYLPFVSGLEINISCPNIDAGGAAMGSCAKSAAEVMRALRPRTKKPLVVKMAPHDVAEIGRALEAEGADGLSLINTIPGMAIDVYSKRSKLAKPTAGISGPCIHHIACRMVWEVAQAVNIPICGIGGVMSWEDAAEFILAGATCVSVGMANLVEPTCAIEIVEGLEMWAQDMGVSDIHELIGAFEC